MRFILTLRNPFLQLLHGCFSINSICTDLGICLEVFFSSKAEVNIKSIISHNVFDGKYHFLPHCFIVDAVRHFRINLMNPFKNHFQLWRKCFQDALETEAKGKAEALRMKKKLEADAADLSLALEHAIAGNAETQNTIKKYQQQVRDAQVKVDEESAAKSAAADAKVAADRKAAAMQNALEESHALLETADRQRRSAEQELADTNETLADLGNVNQSIAAAKRKLESEFNQLGADLDEMSNEARLSEDKAARAMVDAARLADELRCE